MRGSFPVEVSDQAVRLARFVSKQRQEWSVSTHLARSRCREFAATASAGLRLAAMRLGRLAFVLLRFALLLGRFVLLLLRFVAGHAAAS